MNYVIVALDVVLRIARWVVLGAVVLFAVVALLDWLVRTRRVNPFGPVARFVRSSVAPMMAPAERRLLQGGGLPANAPWWTLVAVTLGGIVLLSLLGFLRDQLVVVAYASAAGPLGVLRLVVGWAFTLLQIAILVRVFSAMFRVSPYSPWVRWSYVLSEPILRPLRQVVPPFGMFDLSPLVAYFLIGIVQWAVMNVLPR